MKRKSSFFLLLIGFSLFFSCEKELPYDKGLLSPKIVVQGILEIDSPFVIYLERTYAFNEQNPETQITSEAVITVVNVNSGETFISSVPVDSNRYEFPFNTASNTTYQITVTHPDYPTVTATTSTTQPVPLLSVDTVAVVADYPQMKGTLTWQDPPGEQYYMVRVTSINFDSINNMPMGGSAWCYSNDPSADNSLNSDPIEGGGGSGYYVFSDALFDNTLKTFVTYTSDPFEAWNAEFSTTLTYTLTSINYNTYLYYKSRLVQYYSDPMFSEPSKIYTNVTNGYGVFGSVSGSTVVFED